MFNYNNKQKNTFIKPQESEYEKTIRLANALYPNMKCVSQGEILKRKC